MDDAPQGVLFQVLGPFEAVVDGHAVPLGGAQAGGDGEERLEARGVGFPVADAQHVPG